MLFNAACLELWLSPLSFFHPHISLLPPPLLLDGLVGQGRGGEEAISGDYRCLDNTDGFIRHRQRLRRPALDIWDGSTSGTGLLRTQVLLVTSRFLSFPDSVLTFSPFVMNLEKMEPFFLKKKKKHLAAFVSYFNLPACCLFSVLCFIIDCSHSVLQSCLLSVNTKVRKSLKKEIKRNQNTVWNSHFQSLTEAPMAYFQRWLCFFFQREDWLYFFSVTQHKNGCSGSLKSDPQLWHPSRHLLSSQPRDTRFGLIYLDFFSTSVVETQ